jgi:serine/threonine protein kinase/tetratricopeptide (TPR) repeat protein
MIANNDRDDATRALLILKPDAEISHYRIIRELGAGGMGEVFLAHDNTLNRQVALKFLSPNFATDKVFRERFMREARLAAAFNHPNIITVYEVAESDDRIFIALEYVEGASLREMIDNDRLTLESCVDILLQTCDGLIAAHQSKLIHRDIKPGNIILDKNDRVRILDFGLAKAEGDVQLTQAGMTIGTVSYMSPEQSQGQPPDHRSDIFALGVVFYEMLTGKLPFAAGNIPATLNMIVNQQPLPLAGLNPNLPPALQSIIDKAMAKKPEARYQSAADFKNDLLEYKGVNQLPGQTAVTPIETKPQVKSLAVLHLRNLGSEDDEFLCYGLTEDLIVDLTRIGSIRVASMRSILRFKDSEAELEEIAEKLNVGMILDGAIHKSGNAIRISAHLVEVESGENLWAKRWEEPIDNLPQIKKALADGISQALELEDSVIEKAQIGKTITRDAGAYENYLKAKYHFSHKKERFDVDIALGLYSLALKEEPGLLVARAGLAEILIYNGDFTGARVELEVALENARFGKNRADEANILRLLANLNTKQSNWDEAQKYAENALEIDNENNDLAGEAATLGILISILQPQAKFDEAILHFDRVLEISRHLDDHEKIIDALKNMGIAYSRKGDYERALSLYDECLELARKEENVSMQASCLSNIGNVYYFRGNFDSAYEHYEKALGIADQIGDRALSARQNLNMGLIKLQNSQHQEGARLLDSAANMFQSLGDRSTYALALVNLSQAKLTLGEVEQAMTSAKMALEIAREINSPLVETDALVQLGSSHFFNREIEAAVGYYKGALDIAENTNMPRNVAHIHLALVSICFYCKDYDKCKNHATKALSIAREIGEKTALIMSNAGIAAITACEGLFNTGLRQLQDAYDGISKIGNRQMTLHLKALLGEVLLVHGKTDKDREEGMSHLEAALAKAKENELAPEIKLIDEIITKNNPV